VSASTGRREAHKQATRAALRTAAKRLFTEQGYEATTVADIARAASVTQRTFYRYFDGKEDLIAGEYRAWLDILAGAIQARPGGEPPMAAVRHAMISVGQQASEDDAPAPLWLFTGKPLAGVRRSGARPLVRLETTISGALLDRAGRDRGPAGPEEKFRAQVIARVSVALFRSAMIRHRELRANDAASPGLEQLLDQAFAVIDPAGRPSPGR
jgi:AcrR family transcriptional regulator